MNFIFLAIFSLFLSTSFNLPVLNSSPAINAAVSAYNKTLSSKLITNHHLMVVDFSKPSNQKRMTLIDMNSNKVIFVGYVAHGVKSGDLYATRFSNRDNSHMSSLGRFITLNTYIGKHGYSLKIEGIDKGLNDNAFKRLIAVHGAGYVSGQYVATHGRVGRTWGCFGVDTRYARFIINEIKNGAMIYAFR